MRNKRNSDAGGNREAKPGRRKWTSAEIEKITRLAGRGLSQAVIGQEFGISKQRVGQVFKEFGIPVRRSEKTSAAAVKTMHDFYLTGETFETVARRFGISRVSEVAKLFARENLSVRSYTETRAVQARREKRARMRRTLPKDVLERMFSEENLRVPEIAAHFGCHPSKIWREIKFHNLPKRPPLARPARPPVLDWTEREKVLRRLLFDEKKSVAAAAAELGRTADAVYRQLRKLGIKREPPKKRLAPGKKPAHSPARVKKTIRF